MTHTEGNNISDGIVSSSGSGSTFLQPIPFRLIGPSITSTTATGRATTNAAYQSVTLPSDSEKSLIAHTQRRRINVEKEQQEGQHLLPNGVIHPNQNNYNYPVTWTIIVAMHALQYYRSFYGGIRRRRSARGRTRRGNRRNVTNHHHPPIERKIPWSYVTYDILIHRKQWHKWCLSTISIQQYYSTTSLLDTTTVRNDDNANGGNHHREHWWRSSSRSSHRGGSTMTIRIQIHRCITNVLRQSRNQFRVISYGITRCMIHIGEVLRMLQRHYSTNNDGDRTPLERLQHLYADVLLYYYQNTINYTHRIHSILLLFYVTYLLWSCRLLEYYYIYYYNIDDLDQRFPFDSEENLSRNSSRGADTVIQHDHTSEIPTISWFSIMTYVRVWIGIAITITMLELFIRYFFLQVLANIRHLLIHVVIVRRQEDLEQRQQLPSESPPLFGEPDTSSTAASERPDIVPLFPDYENDTDDHNNRLHVHLDTVHESQLKLRNNLMCVNMIQMISSILMIYRCIIVNYHKSSHANEDTDLFGRHNTNNVPLQYLYRTDWIPNRMISPIPYIWPSFLFGTNLSYATCLLLLYWLSLSPIIPNAVVLAQQQERQTTTITNEEIPIVADTDNPVAVPKKKSSSLHTVHSIMNGTLVGWLWGNAYFMIPTLATPCFGNAIFIIVLIGSIIAMKARYPNALLLQWLSSVGCNRLGQPLIYDTNQNSWINDPVYCVDTIQIVDEDDDSEAGDDIDDDDIEVGNLDREYFDDDNQSDNSVENTLHQQEMTSLLNSINIPNNFRSRRNTTIANGN